MPARDRNPKTPVIAATAGGNCYSADEIEHLQGGRRLSSRREMHANACETCGAIEKSILETASVQ